MVVPMEYSDEDAEEYKREFECLLTESQNDIFKDRKTFAIEDDILEEMYNKKDYAMDTLIISLLDRKGDFNWGYIPETTGGKNSIQRGKRMIQLGFDLEGFSMPIRLHHSLENIRQHVKGYTGKDEFPVYEGNSDWMVQDQFGRTVRISTQVFLPTQKEERKKIKEMAGSLSEGNRLYEFLTHMNWMANRTVPTRFGKRKVVSLDTGIISDRGVISLDD